MFGSFYHNVLKVYLCCSTFHTSFLFMAQSNAFFKSMKICLCNLFGVRPVIDYRGEDGVWSRLDQSG